MSKRWRVYFNRRGAPKGKIWCVDRGHGTRRRYFDSVAFEHGTTDYTGREPDWKDPVAWINVEGELHVWESHKDSKHAAIRSMNVTTKQIEEAREWLRRNDWQNCSVIEVRQLAAMLQKRGTGDK